MRNLLAVLAVLSLAACAGTAAPVGQAPTGLQSLADFTVADLKASSDDAKAQVPPDDDAAQCYDYLITVVPTVGSHSLGGQTVGAFLAFQKARDLINSTTAVNSALKKLNHNCAALVIDTQTTINKLLILGGGAAMSGGLLPPIP